MLLNLARPLLNDRAGANQRARERDPSDARPLNGRDRKWILTSRRQLYTPVNDVSRAAGFCKFELRFTFFLVNGESYGGGHDKPCLEPRVYIKNLPRLRGCVIEL